MRSVQRAYTQRELEEAAERDDTLVMKPAYDNVFDPWSADDVENTLGAICNMTLEHRAKPLAEIQRIVRASRQFDEFERLYPTFFTKMCTPAFISNPEHMLLVRTMLSARESVRRGELTQEEANNKVSHDTLISMYKLAREAQTVEDE